MNVGDATVTPVARSFTVRWPGGRAVWSGPALVRVEREGRIERIPIANLNRRIRWSMSAGAFVLIARWFVSNRRGANSND